MLKNGIRYVLLGVLVMVISACSGNTEVLPTLIPSSTPPPATATLEVVATATTEPTATTVRTRPTLPPTFTPTVEASPTPTETSSVPTPTLFVPATANTDCNIFDIVFEQTTPQFQIGSQPTVAWTPLPGAELYLLRLLQSGGFVVQDNIYIAETTYTFDASLFRENFTYGWEVYPINNAGDQMCFSIGTELIPLAFFRPTPGS
jgi:hypothetical protein